MPLSPDAASDARQDPDAERLPDATMGYPPIIDRVPYIPTRDLPSDKNRFFLGTGDIVLDGARTSIIDTDLMTVDGVTYPFNDDGPVIFDWQHIDPLDLYHAPQLAILHVASFTIGEGHVARAQGNRALVILADVITIDGLLDAAGHGPEHGPGGRESGTGYILDDAFPTAGRAGVRVSSTGSADGGASGGALVTAGTSGGSAGAGAAVGGATSHPFQGAPYLPFLLGGSGGGRSSARPTTDPLYCPAANGGGGGGAVLLYAQSALRIGPSGAINAGGGGGQGGGPTGCRSGGDPTAGGGGGSGGMIILQSRSVSIAGRVAANGGGGGGGAGTLASPSESGGNGEDGRLDYENAAGGPGYITFGGAGGVGAALDSPNIINRPDGPGQTGSSNGGGGGGGIGLIHIYVAGDGVYDSAMRISPDPYFELFQPGGRL